MSFKLTYTNSEGTTITRFVEPAGQYAIVTNRVDHRFYEEFTGTMTLKKDDFLWVMAAGPCTEIKVECQFKKLWKGVFSHADCTTINRSKKYLEVQPRHDDEYSKIEPWMGLEMNIIPPREGINSKVIVNSLNQYEIETRTVRINEPYDGPNAENWVGYSVNDWIVNNGTIPQSPAYRGDRQVNNSLIRKLIGPTPHFAVNLINTDAFNRIAWLDLRGYEIYTSGESLGNNRLVNSYWRESMFTLAEVINYYSDEEGTQWEYCDLVYKRELWKGKYITVTTPNGSVFGWEETPPSGLFFDSQSINSGSESTVLRVNTGRWIWNVSEKKWIRRYLALHERGTQGAGQDDQLPDNGKTGDGFDFTPLVKGFQDDMTVRKQVLFRNKYEEQDGGTNWYIYLYETVFYENHFHKIKPILQKYIAFLKSKGANTSLTIDDIKSRFLFDENNPYTGWPNIWPKVLIGQNSDIKRPLSSERAAKEMISFTDFLDVLCKLTNTAWAIIDGEFVIEHVSYFEKALNYGGFVEASSIFNPYSIVNVAKNKGFMNLTDIYRYEKRLMPKYEIYKTVGGEEPKNNNLTIEYDGGCINNRPNENIFEIEINTTTDYEHARSEGRDEGITFILTEEVYLAPPIDAILNTFYPKKDEFGRFIYNEGFDLEAIIREYHDYGRVLSQAKINNAEWTNLVPFKNIIQNVSFPYVAQAENPYTQILTGIGTGIINRAEYVTKDGWVNYELRYSNVQDFDPGLETIDWHIHIQNNPVKLWEVNHNMNTSLIMRPVVFDESNQEIEYSELRILDNNSLILRFSEPVIGQAHFIALNIDPANLNTVSFNNTTSFTFDHQLNGTAKNILLTPFVDTRGNEIRPSLVAYINNDVIEVEFSEPASGFVTAAKVEHPYVTIHDGSTSVNEDEITLPKGVDKVYNKPLVLTAQENIIYHSHSLLATLRSIGFSEDVIAYIVVMEKNKS